MFYAILGLWAIQSLGHDTPGLVKDGFTLVAWVSGWTSHSLAILHHCYLSTSHRQERL